MEADAREAKAKVGADADLHKERCKKIIKLN